MDGGDAECFPICLGLGMVGAARYNATYVLVALIAYVSKLLLPFVFFNPVGMLVDCLFLRYSM